MFQDDLADRFLEAKLLGHLRADLAVLHAVGPGLAEIVEDGAAGEQVLVHRNFYPAGDLQGLARHLQAVLDRLGGAAGVDQGSGILHQQILGHMEEKFGNRFLAPGLFDIGPVFGECGQIVTGRLVVGMVVQPVVQRLVVVAGPAGACFQVFWVGRHDVLLNGRLMDRVWVEVTGFPFAVLPARCGETKESKRRARWRRWQRPVHSRKTPPEAR